jgi:hypothetical protein
LHRSHEHELAGLLRAATPGMKRLTATFSGGRPVSWVDL